jgi:acetoin utilization deacetylase AcuC-like enzyme
MSVGYAYAPIFEQHNTGDHPERAERLTAILQHLRRSDLFAQLELIAVEPVTPRDLGRVHSSSLIQRLRDYSLQGGGYLTPDTILSPASFDAALMAAGASIAATREVIEGRVSASFALVRPPGHHATRAQSMGFCLLNNPAIAATWALAEAGLQRVAIVDFDVHHGNGTEEIVRPDSRILYISTHQFPLYPGTGHWRQAGAPGGAETIIDIPLPPGTGDVGYIDAFRRIVQPALARFAPEVILVSAGYDAHWADPLSWMLVSVGGFAQMVALLRESARALCDGRLALLLEGGYDLEALPACVTASFAALLDAPYDDPLGLAREPEAEASARISYLTRWYGLV